MEGENSARADAALLAYMKSLPSPRSLTLVTAFVLNGQNQEEMKRAFGKYEQAIKDGLAPEKPSGYKLIAGLETLRRRVQSGEFEGEPEDEVPVRQDKPVPKKPAVKPRGRELSDADVRPKTRPAPRSGSDEVVLPVPLTETYLRVKPNDSEALREYGRSLGSAGRHDEAVTHLQKAVRAGSSDTGTHLALAHSAFAAGRYDLAEDAARRVLRADPGNPAAESIEKLARRKVRAGEMKLPEFEAGSSPDPGGAPGGAKSRGRPPRGRFTDETALESEALTREAANLLSIGDLEKALAKADAAVKLNPENAQALLLRGIAAGRLGRYAEAARDTERALAAFPDNKSALLSHAWMLAHLGRFAEAERLAERATREHPGAAEGWMILALSRFGREERAAGLAALKRAAELDSRMEGIYDRAERAPQDADLNLLFDGALFGDARAEWTAPGGPRLAARLPLRELGGGLLLLGLLGLLHPAVRKRLTTTRGAGRGPGEFTTRYDILGRIGAGGMGVVYEGLDRGLGRKVAIKKMREELRENAVERARFLKEARIVAALRHPGIVAIHAVIEDGSDAYLVFEFISGRTLADILAEKRRLPFEQGVEIVRLAAEAVAHAHGQGIVHRDLKPSNIMIDDSGEVKVTDFGVARVAKDALSRLSTGTIAGTPLYMAPEQELGKAVPASDVYALGIVLHELLAGSVPPRSDPPSPLPAEAARDVPLTLGAVLAKTRAARPESRYPDAGAFARALGELPARHSE